MRRWAQRIVALWFVISMTMAQACVTPSQTSSPGSQGSSSVGVETTQSIAGGGSLSPTADHENPSDTQIDTTGYTPDEAESQALTEYLTQHRLPLVGAQVLNGPDGQRAVVLYGFVGSDFGRNDAADKARRFTGNPSMAVDNRIKVRPELLASGSQAATPDAGTSANPEDGSSADDSYPGVDSYTQQQSNALNQYQQSQSPGSSMGSMLPLIMMLGMLGMSMASGGSGFSMGSPMGSPYGYSPYNSYPGYPSGSPYGSPYAPSPYSASPFGPPPMSPYYH